MRKQFLIISLLTLSFCFVQAQNVQTEIISKLKQGNERFFSGQSEYPNLGQDRRNETSTNGQNPFVTVITCSDSRVPVENIFDAGIGDVFVIRVAGNVVNADEAGSIEYGVDHLHTPVFIVLGHTHCGAVTAVVKDVEVHGNIPKLIENIHPAVQKAREKHGEEFNEELLLEAIKSNVWHSIEDLFAISEISKQLVQEGNLKIVGALYHIEDGKVEWLGEHPNQSNLIH